MVDIERIRALVEMMVEGDLARISLRDGDQRIDIRRTQEQHGGNGTAPAGMVAQMAIPQEATTNVPPPQLPSPPQVEDNLVAIESPMVGTFYSAPSPGQPPYISVGSEVSSETVVCIVEAMKVFNEIKAEVTGRVEKILVKNGDSVEFGQKIFLVKP